MKPRNSFVLIVLCCMCSLVFLHSFGQKQPVDTLFLLKEKNHRIFIEPFTNSEKYKTIADFSFAEYQMEDYLVQLEKYEQDETEFKHFSLGKFPRQWINIHLYKRKPYAYYPCDFLNYSALLFTDSTLLEIGGEGPQVFPLLEFKKINEKKYVMKTSHRKTIFHFLQISGKQVTVAENYYYDGDASLSIPIYQLLIPASQITSIPLIVNECINDKAIEFSFDYPDFKKYVLKK